MGCHELCRPDAVDSLSDATIMTVVTAGSTVNLPWSPEKNVSVELKRSQCSSSGEYLSQLAVAMKDSVVVSVIHNSIFRFTMVSV